MHINYRDSKLIPLSLSYSDTREIVFHKMQSTLAERDLEFARLQQLYSETSLEIAELKRIARRETVNMDYLKNIVLQVCHTLSLSLSH